VLAVAKITGPRCSLQPLASASAVLKAQPPEDTRLGGDGEQSSCWKQRQTAQQAAQHSTAQHSTAQHSKQHSTAQPQQGTEGAHAGVAPSQAAAPGSATRQGRPASLLDTQQHRRDGQSSSSSSNSVSSGGRAAAAAAAAAAACSSSSGSSSSSSSNSSRATPGCRRTQVMLSGARSMDMDLLTMLRAHLEARYAYPPPLPLSSTDPTCHQQQSQRRDHHSCRQSLHATSSCGRPTGER
jgi:hypothetical protein